MAITRAQAEAVLISRAKRRMALVDFSTTASGTNADLDDPLATALRQMGLTASIPVVNGDFDDLADESQEEFLGRAELRLLQNIHGSLDLADIQVGTRRESSGQIVDQLGKAIERLSARLEKEFGASLGKFAAGGIYLNFAAKRSPEDYDEQLVV